MLTRCAFLSLIGLAACEDDDVPNISGSYTCDLKQTNDGWCHDDVVRPHIVQSMRISIDQSLPGSGMHVNGWGARMDGFVTASGYVYADAEHVTCDCSSPNEYDLKLEAHVSGATLSDVALEERRFGRSPAPERAFFGYPYDNKVCFALWEGTCTRDAN